MQKLTPNFEEHLPIPHTHLSKQALQEVNWLECFVQRLPWTVAYELAEKIDGRFC